MSSLQYPAQVISFNDLLLWSISWACDLHSKIDGNQYAQTFRILLLSQHRIRVRVELDRRYESLNLSLWQLQGIVDIVVLHELSETALTKFFLSRKLLEPTMVWRQRYLRIPFVWRRASPRNTPPIMDPMSPFTGNFATIVAASFWNTEYISRSISGSFTDKKCRMLWRMISDTFV